MIKLITPADVISMTNAGLGFLALFVISIPFFCELEAYRWSFTLILLALLADGLDGIIARKTRKGPLGPYLESMADLTSTGIATSIFVFHSYFPTMSSQSIIGIISFFVLVLFYLFCCILRLASFHPLNTINHYIGLPAPSAAILLLCCSYVNIPYFYFLLVILLISVLMITPIQYLKPSLPLNILTAVLIFLIMIFDDIFNNIFIWIIIFLIISYIFGGPFFVDMKIIKNK